MCVNLAEGRVLSREYKKVSLDNEGRGSLLYILVNIGLSRRPVSGIRLNNSVIHDGLVNH